MIKRIVKFPKAIWLRSLCPGTKTPETVSSTSICLHMPSLIHTSNRAVALTGVSFLVSLEKQAANLRELPQSLICSECLCPPKIHMLNP